jgi:hypothetical protein
VKVSVSNVGWDTGYLTVRKRRCVQCFGREASLEMATWGIEEVVYMNVTET